MGLKFYNERKFDQATQMFCGAYAIKEFLGIDFKDAAIGRAKLLKRLEGKLKQQSFE